MAQFEGNPAAVPALPAEYQTQIDEQQRRRALAQALMQSAMQQQGGQQGQMISGHYVAPSPLQHIAPLLQMLAARQGDTAAAGQADTIRRQAATEQQSALSGVDPNDPKSLIAGMASKFPAVGAHANALYKALMDRRKDWFDKAAPIADPKSIIGSEGDPTKLTPAGPWTEGQTSAGSRYVQDPGSRHAPVFEPGTGTTVNLGPKFAEEQAGKNYDALRTARPSIMQATQSLPQLANAYDMLQKTPLNLGAGASTQTSIQALSKWLGIPVPENVPASQFLSETLLPAFTADLKKIAPTGSTSDREMTVAQQLAVNAQKDPRMLGAAIAQAARAHKAVIDDYNQQLEAAHSFATESKLPPNKALLPAQYKIYGLGAGEDPSNAGIHDLFHTPVQELLKRMPPAQAKPGLPPGRINQAPGTDLGDAIEKELQRRMQSGQ